VNMPAVVLAAHGSRRDPTANKIVQRLADRVAATGYFDQVATAFNQGTPTFATVLDSIAADAFVVVPVMTSEGFFSQVFLPEQLALNQCYERVTVRVTSALGTHARIVNLVEQQIATDTTHVIIVGHGSERHVQSRRATDELAAKLSARLPRKSVRVAFLDESPCIEDVVSMIPDGSRAVVIPFLIGGGHHATRDIPDGLGSISDGSIACGEAIGGHPELWRVVVDLARGESHASAPDILENLS
jgi:sirohydrochlorin cobaltochelatase